MFSFYGIVSMIIYFAPLPMGLGTSLARRAVIIVLVLLTLPIVLLIGFVVSRRSAQKEAAKKAEAEAKKGDDSGGDKAPKTVKATGKFPELNTNADEAFKFLQESQLGGAKGREAVYALPFYIFAGLPQSGKTSLVLSSGLNFQNLPSQRQSEQKFIRPTRSVDWRMTSEAVILDTAGRYQAEGIDQEEWAGISDVLKKNRSVRPLDGFVLVVDSAKLMTEDDAEIEQHAKTLRARLDEMVQLTKTRFPVYLVFSNADTIEGFRDSFSTSNREGQKFVWGATFPLEKTPQAHSLFDSEFDLLYDALMKRRLLRLSAPFPPIRQLRIFNFPLHFNSTRRKLGQFVTALFRPNPFNESPMFRGFYFVGNVSTAGSAQGQTAAQVNQLDSISTSYFSERFVKDVLLRDKDLVATFQAQKVKPPIFGWILLVLGTFIATVLLAGTGISFYYNNKLVDEGTERGMQVFQNIKNDKGKDLKTKSPREVNNEITDVDKLRETLVKLDDYDRNGVPLWLGFGLYSGDKLYKEKLLPAYFNAVEQRYKEPVVRQIEDDLKKFAVSPAITNVTLTDDQEKTLGKNYDLLKAYLMLSGDFKAKAEPTFLAAQLEPYWVQAAPPEFKETSKKQLEFWAKQVDREASTQGSLSLSDNRYVGFPRIDLDKALVDSTRKKLEAYPAVFRYLKRVTTDVDKQLDKNAKSVENILAGRSGGQMEGSYTVPPSYTYEGYQVLKPKFDTEALVELGQIDWVMGEQASLNKVSSTQDDVRKLKERYENNSTDHWRKLVETTKVKEYKAKSDLQEGLQRFSSTESPMEILLQEVARQTRLSAKPTAGSWYDWLMSYMPGAAKDTKDATLTKPEQEFGSIFTFTGNTEKKDDNPPISKYRSAIKKVSDIVSGASDDKIKQITDDLAKEDDSKIGLQKAETAVNTLTEGFTTTAAQDVANLLKKPLQNTRSFFGAGLQQQLDKVWRDQIFAEAQKIEKGFPFTPDGESDLATLTAFLNPQNGKLTKYYKDSLDKYFEIKNDSLVPKESSDTKNVQFTQEFIDYLNNAFALRKGLFGENSPTPEFKYQIKMLPVKEAIVEIKIDGQPLTSESTSSAEFVFPARSGGETGAVIQISGTGSTITTAATPSASPTASPTTANANTSATNANANVSKLQAAPKANANTNANSSASADAATSIREQGTWGLFKLFEKAGSPSKNANGEYVLNYKVGGKAVTLIIKPVGVDLFDKTKFTKLRAPQNILKQQ